MSTEQGQCQLHSGPHGIRNVPPEHSAYLAGHDKRIIDHQLLPYVGIRVYNIYIYIKLILMNCGL